ncbi:hypothetical protein lerEdw1_015095, partial [Lerista edwardsae]
NRRRQLPIIASIIGVIAVAIMWPAQELALPVACPSGWLNYEGKCYFFSEEERSWTSSRSFCVSCGSSLVAIESETEKVFLLRYMGTTGHWIGLQKDPHQTFTWVDGTKFNSLLEMKGGTGDCAFLNTGFAEASDCHIARKWICSQPDAYTRSKHPTTGEGRTKDHYAICKIQEVLSNETVAKSTRLLYRTVILFLLLAIIILLVRQARVTLPAPHCDPPCPRHWIGYEEKCYFFSREKRNWTSSQSFCSSFNASLTRIEIDEKDFVMRLKCKDISWIGLWRDSDNSWLWADGEMSILEVFGEGGNCAYLDNEGKAISSGCHTKLPWICSKPMAYTTPNTV